MIEALQYEFIRNAIVSGILVSIACGVIGTLVVLNRMVFISGGIAHAAYGGIGLAVLLGISPLLGAGVFSIVIALVIGILTLGNTRRIDAIIGALWALGMALGIISLDFSKTYSADLMSFLFGSILSVPSSDIVWSLILVALILCFYLLNRNDLIAMSFDREFASLRSVRVNFLHLSLLVITALTVVMTIRLVGLILVIALITIPPYISEDCVGSIGKMITLSSALGSLFTIAGLWLSYQFDITAGAAIILIASVVFFLHAFFRSYRSKNGFFTLFPHNEQ